MCSDLWIEWFFNTIAVEFNCVCCSDLKYDSDVAAGSGDAVRRGHRTSAEIKLG